MALARALFLVLLSLTQLALGGVGNQSVLCIEPGGRVSIEQVGALCCDAHDESAPAPEAAAGESLSSADCCACVDIPLPGLLDRSSARGAAVVKLEHSLVPALGAVLVPTFRGLLEVEAAVPVDPGGDRTRPRPRTFAVLRC